MPRRNKDAAFKALEFSRIHPEAEAWRKVLSLGKRVKLLKGASINYGENADDNLYFLEKGEFRLVRTSLDGREKIIWAIGPGSLVGETPFFDELPSHSRHVAATDSVLYAFSRKCVLEKILPHEPELMMCIFRSLASKVRVLSNQSVCLCMDDLASRICKFLHLRMAHYAVEDNSTFVCPGLNQQELANFLGVHRVTLNKVLRELEKAQILSPYSRDEVCILDVKRFQEIAFENK
jgi:CRP-like cAMP-binding protein